jgi:hypothetical protein
VIIIIAMFKCPKTRAAVYEMWITFIKYLFSDGTRVPLDFGSGQAAAGDDDDKVMQWINLLENGQIARFGTLRSEFTTLLKIIGTDVKLAQFATAQMDWLDQVSDASTQQCI